MATAPAEPTRFKSLTRAQTARSMSLSETIHCIPHDADKDRVSEKEPHGEVQLEDVYTQERPIS